MNKSCDMFFLNDALASDAVNNVAANATSVSNVVNSLIPLLIFIGVFYLLLIRPQQKKQKEHENEVKSLKQNDKVLTAGGIYGTVVKVKEKSILISVANGVEIEVVPDTLTVIKEEVQKKPSKVSEKKR